MSSAQADHQSVLQQVAVAENHQQQALKDSQEQVSSSYKIYILQ